MLQTEHQMPTSNSFQESLNLDRSTTSEILDALASMSGTHTIFKDDPVLQVILETRAFTNEQIFLLIEIAKEHIASIEEKSAYMDSIYKLHAGPEILNTKAAIRFLKYAQLQIKYLA